MSTVIAVPQAYVGVALLSTVFLLAGQSVMVGRHREKAGIKYPQLYAEKAEAENNPNAYLFNCAQRAHQNTLENIPIIYVTTVLAGLQYPIVAASACGLWVLGRISYTRGYVSGPANRNSPLSKLSYLGLLTLLASSVTAVVQSVRVV